MATRSERTAIYVQLQERMRDLATRLAEINMAIQFVNDFLVFDYDALDEVLDQVSNTARDLKRNFADLRGKKWEGFGSARFEKP